MNNLVVVESPTKAKTISKFLGKDYTIKFSMGHIIDLPKNKLGINIDNSFTPEYEIIDDKRKIITELQVAAGSADSIILATDPDREGEAIASNIRDILSENKKLKIDKSKFKRIVFHEITESAVKQALSNPRDVDENLVNSQTARRVLDRLVGYQLSPVLWKKIRRGLSAGRVQSIALRFILEREQEIEKFERQRYYSVHVLLKKDSNAVDFNLIEVNNDKIDVSQKHQLYDGEYNVTKTIIDTQDKADQILNDLNAYTFEVSDINTRQAKRSPLPVYTTSTLQQDASRRFGYSGKRTMSLAQKLYEEGYITYHRTDSVNISSNAISQIREFVKKEYGEKYISEKPRVYSAKQKLAQEAHEGIRPTNMFMQAPSVKESVGPDYAKLYEIIWLRAIASQMSDAIIESTTVYVDASGKGTNKYRFKASGSILVFDGFLKLTPHALKDTQLPKFKANEALALQKAFSETHETAPPPRYNDASLIATLEERGIGRPSTYASIISILTDRSYVERVEKRFEPTPIGKAVNEFLVTNFSTIDDIPFTAKMEDELDNIAQGKLKWIDMMEEFYKPFGKQIASVEDASRVKIQAEQTDELCPECNAPLVIRHGRFGKFFSCSRFPDCRFTRPFVEATNLLCPKDEGKVIIKKTRKGRRFYGCSNYPKCDFAAWKLENIKNISKKSDH